MIDAKTLFEMPPEADIYVVFQYHVAKIQKKNVFGLWINYQGDGEIRKTSISVETDRIGERANSWERQKNIGSEQLFATEKEAQEYLESQPDYQANKRLIEVNQQMAALQEEREQLIEKLGGER